MCVKKYYLLFILLGLSILPLRTFTVDINSFSAQAGVWTTEVQRLLTEINSIQEKKIAPDIAKIKESSKKIEESTNKIQKDTASLLELQKGSKKLWQEMAKSIALEKLGQVLEFNGSSVTATSSSNLSYNGKSFQGANRGFIDNIVGKGGTPLALDNEMPSRIFPIKGGDSAILDKFQKLSSKKGMNSIANSALQNMFSLGLNKVNEKIAKATDGVVKNAIPNMMGDGIFKRPYQGAMDDAYSFASKTASPTEIMAFYGQKAAETFNPLIGKVPSETRTPVSMDNILSTGAEFAYYDYASKNGLSGAINPYDGYGSDMINFAIQKLGNKPGTEIRITADDVRNFQRGVIPEIQTQISKAPKLFSANGQPNANYALVGLNQPELTYVATGGSQDVMAVTLTGQDSERFTQEMQSSNQRISKLVERQRNLKSRIESENKAIDALKEIYASGDKLRKKAGEKDVDAVAEITQLCQKTLEMATHRKDAINDCQKEISELEFKVDGLIEARQEYKNEINDKLEFLAARRAQNTLLEAQSAVKSDEASSKSSNSTKTNL